MSVESELEAVRRRANLRAEVRFGILAAKIAGRTYPATPREAEALVACAREDTRQALERLLPTMSAVLTAWGQELERAGREFARWAGALR